jgi:hypothetical protein
MLGVVDKVGEYLNLLTADGRPGAFSAESADGPSQTGCLPHVAAMATPGAAGKRYLLLADGPTTTFLEVAGVLPARRGEFAATVPTEEAPG